MLALLLVLAATACDDSTGPGSRAVLTVSNQTITPVWFMYISPCSASDWGNDQLGSNETIASGGRRSWNLREGCYDLRAEFSDGGFAEEFDVQLYRGDEFVWTIYD